MPELVTTEIPYETQLVYDQQRAAQDDALIRCGAVRETLGRILITRDQLDLLREIEPSVEASGMPVRERTPAESWLDTRFTSAPYQSIFGTDPACGEISFSHDTFVPLHREGIRTVRDVYIIGMTSMGELGLIGKQVYREIKRAVNDNEFGIKWKPQPTIEDIAQLSADLHEVPAYVLSRSDLLAASTNRIAARYRTPLIGLSVQVVLDATTDLPLPKKTSHLFSHHDSWEGSQLRKKHAIRTAATEFAGKYALAKLAQSK